MASILSHAVPEERLNPGLQNHEDKPSASAATQEEEGGEPGKSADPETPLHHALVAHVSGPPSDHPVGSLSCTWLFLGLP